MLRVFLIVAAWGAMAIVVIAPERSLAQYDLNTCTGKFNYCVELSRRAGSSDAPCAAAYQECLRTGVRPDRYLSNPYAAPSQPGTAYDSSQLPLNRRDTNNPYAGPVERQFCVGRVNCLPQR
jgi:hypothetical protein